MRRTVTVLFIDVVGSTSIGEHHDAESVRRTLTEYFSTVRRIVTQHGGTMEKFIGDAVMAVFGFPVQREDDALRAVRAAVQARAALQHRLPTASRTPSDLVRSLITRTGVQTGEVVAGDPALRGTFITGDAVNVAARLQQVAAGGEILIGDACHRLVQHAIRFGKPRNIAVRGKSDQVRVHPVTDVIRDASGIVRHLEVPLVGRELELSLIAGAHELSRRAGRPGLFTLLGPAGIGKTRLASEFLSSVQGATVLHVRARHDQAEDGSLITQLLRQAQAATNAGADGLAQVSDVILDELATRQPLVVAVDDLQSADASMLGWLERLAVHARGPVFVLVMARPELLEELPAWGRGMLNATSLTLGGLDGDSMREIGRQILGDLPPVPAWDQIAAASEGNPLYLEHVVADLVDRGMLGLDSHGLGGIRQLSHIGTPGSISALIGARLDRLPAVERIALECAAVIGTAFDDATLAELVPPPLTDGLEHSITELLRKQWIRPSAAGEGSFEFTNSTVRDVAYGRLSKASRADLHERAGAIVANAASGNVKGLRATQHFDSAAGYRLEVGLAPRQGMPATRHRPRRP